MNLINSILSMPRIYKRIVSISVDTAFIFLAFFSAFITRLADVSFLDSSEYWQVLIAVWITTLLVFIRVGLYRAILRFLSVHALLTIVISCSASALALVVFGYYADVFIPRSIPIIYGTYLVFLCGGARLLVRVSVSKQKSSKKESVIIYGAGESGRQLLNLLRQGDELHPVAFIDDERKLLKTVVNGLTVYGKGDLTTLVQRRNVGKVLLAMPSALRCERKAIIDSLVDLPVKVLSTPHFQDLLSGAATIDQLRDVPIEDLLARECISSKAELLDANIKNKVVMVTGAGGSIGSELCRQILLQQPHALVLFELSEYALYQIAK